MTVLGQNIASLSGVLTLAPTTACPFCTSQWLPTPTAGLLICCSFLYPTVLADYLGITSPVLWAWNSSANTSQLIPACLSDLISCFSPVPCVLDFACLPPSPDLGSGYQLHLVFCSSLSDLL